VWRDTSHAQQIYIFLHNILSFRIVSIFRKLGSNQTKRKKSILLYSVWILKVWIQSSKCNICRSLDPIQRPRKLRFAATVAPNFSRSVWKHRLKKRSLETSAGDTPWPLIPMAMVNSRPHVLPLDGLAFHVNHLFTWRHLVTENMEVRHTISLGAVSAERVCLEAR
jgi:hypothetical protein